MSNVVEMARPDADTATFEEFWIQYPWPRRQRKALAKAKWDAITGPGLKTKTFDKDSNSYVDIELKATPEEIIDGVKRYAEQNRATGTGQYGFKDDGKFICLPSTWLNQGRWLD